MTAPSKFGIAPEVPFVNPPEAPIAELHELAKFTKANPGVWATYCPTLTNHRGETYPDYRLMRRMRAEINSGKSREFGPGYIVQTRGLEVGHNPRTGKPYNDNAAGPMLYVKYVGRIEVTKCQRVAR